jgi:hypothetical protein
MIRSTDGKSSKSFGKKAMSGFPPGLLKQQAMDQSPAPSQGLAPSPNREGTIGLGSYGESGKLGRKKKISNDNDLPKSPKTKE